MQTIILSGLRSSQFCGEFTAVRSCRIRDYGKEDVAGGIGICSALLLMDPSAVRQMIIDNYGGVRWTELMPIIGNSELAVTQIPGVDGSWQFCIYTWLTRQEISRR